MAFNSIVKNISWLIFDYAFKFIGLFVIGTLVARYLGPELFGKFSYVQSIILMLCTLCSFGLPSILLKEFSEKDSKDSYLFGSALAIYLFFIGCSFGIIIIISLNYSGSDEDLVLMLLVFSIRFISMPSEIWKVFFESKVQSKYFVIAEFYSYIILFGLQIFFVLYSYNVIYLISAIVIQTLISSLILTYFLFHKYKIAFKLNLKFIKYLIRKSSFPFYSSIAVIIYMQLDRIMLHTLIGEYETGIYSAAMRVATVFFIIPTIIINSFFPHLISRKNYGDQYFIKDFKKIFELLILLSFFICILISFFSKQIILILYGSTYEEASFILLVLSFYVILNFYGTIRGKYLLAKGLIKYDFYVHIVALIINAVLNFILIPNYGAYGAVLATIFTGLVCIFFPLILIKTTRDFVIMSLGIISNMLKLKFLKRGYFYD